MESAGKGTIDVIDDPGADHRVIRQNDHRRDERQQPDRRETEPQEKQRGAEENRREAVMSRPRQRQRPEQQQDRNGVRHPGTLDLKSFERPVRIAPGLAPDRNLAEHQRQPEEQDAAEINQHERASPVHARDIRKLPDVAESDGGPGGGENETEFAAPTFARLRIHCVAFLSYGFNNKNPDTIPPAAALFNFLRIFFADSSAAVYSKQTVNSGGGL